MARKKVSLGTTPRRAPALVARRPARLAEPIAAPAKLPPPTALVRPIETDRDAVEAKLFQLVSPHSRVLVIGRDTWPLARSLSTAGCSVSVVETRHDAPAGAATFAERVVVGDPDVLDLSAALDGAQFEVIVAVRLLEHVQEPVGMLTMLARHLSPDGAIVAAVPNVMHGRIRLEFLAGRSPSGFLSADTGSPSRWYDSAALHQTFERARFAITRIERHLEAFDAGSVPTSGSPLPPALVDELTRDTDAMTRAFIVMAHPVPLGRNVRMEIRVRELTELHDRALEQLRAIEERTGDLDRRYAEAMRVVDGAVSKIDRIGADVQRAALRDSAWQPALANAHQRLTSHRVELETIRRDLTRFQYEQLIPRLRTMVEAAVPSGAVALVVSKGDERMLAFSGRTGWHFLRNDKGVYAGHHPADSAAAIQALERLRAAGARYLVIPQVALWWLDHYTGLREHLKRRGRLVARNDRTGAIYSLARPGAAR
jgi:SAM-dependent methyltransferase